MTKEIEILKRALAREKEARKQAEKILEEKASDLFQLTTDLRTANEKLEGLVSERTSELEGVFENIIDSYVVMNLSGDVLKMNDAAKELFGYDIDKEPLNVLSLIYKEDIPYAMQSYQELVKEGAFTNYNARVYTKHREVKNVQINASLIFNVKKEPIAAQGIVRDTTDQVKNQQIFEEQKKQLSVIVENSSLGIVLTQYGKIVQTNGAFQQLLGFTADELVTMNVQDISVKDEYHTSKEKMEALNNGDIDSFSIQKKYRKKNGGVLTAKTNVSAVWDDMGNVKYQVAIIEDMTEQLKQQLKEKKLLNDLEKSNQELNDYAHIVSHDLKSPLRSISSLISWLQEDYAQVFDEKASTTFDMLHKKVDKMDQLINGVLQYASIDRIEKKVYDINLNQIVQDIIEVIYIPEHASITITNKLPTVRGDEFRLQQLFQNLISNAIKYNDKKKGVVEIGCKEKEQFWEFSIKDNGIGVEHKYFKKIFNVFQSLESENNSTGIGLSIVKKIVDFYGGAIWLTSQLGEGSTFYFTLKK
ncbi:PAS domain-containing sensor histidine kinase [Spongiivirga citrea]|uniref:histidine kinase n=1 Tax=Spongiivirga citrea TaxID=1481457 RepID=A0A6M0CK76_9FLAO|nr:PAS domain-containing sensor histidine kinase [Spongiivirga citrea]NER17363.1 PAS domain S-box protein [Spongiivirga citrea]